MSTSVLALLIALISVTSVVGPIIIDMTKADASRIRAIVQSVSNERKIVVYFSNTGTKPAVIGAPELAIKRNEMRAVVPLRVESGSSVLQPGAVALMTFTLATPAFPEDPTRPGSLNFRGAGKAYFNRLQLLGPGGKQYLEIISIPVIDYGANEPRTLSLPLDDEGRTLSKIFAKDCIGFSLRDSGGPAECRPFFDEMRIFAPLERCELTFRAGPGIPPGSNACPPDKAE